MPRTSRRHRRTAAQQSRIQMLNAGAVQACSKHRSWRASLPESTRPHSGSLADGSNNSSIVSSQQLCNPCVQKFFSSASAQAANTIQSRHLTPSSMRLSPVAVAGMWQVLLRHPRLCWPYTFAVATKPDAESLRKQQWLNSAWAWVPKHGFGLYCRKAA